MFMTRTVLSDYPALNRTEEEYLAWLEPKTDVRPLYCRSFVEADAIAAAVRTRACAYGGIVCVQTVGSLLGITVCARKGDTPRYRFVGDKRADRYAWYRMEMLRAMRDHMPVGNFESLRGDPLRKAVAILRLSRLRVLQWLAAEAIAFEGLRGEIFLLERWLRRIHIDLKEQRTDVNYLRELDEMRALECDWRERISVYSI